MDIGKDIRYKAKNLLLEYGISKVTLENLIYIIEDQGFEIIEYSQRDRSDSVWTVLNTLNLTAYAESGKAFAYKCGKSKLLFCVWKCLPMRSCMPLPRGRTHNLRTSVQRRL